MNIRVRELHVFFGYTFVGQEVVVHTRIYLHMHTDTLLLTPLSRCLSHILVSGGVCTVCT